MQAHSVGLGNNCGKQLNQLNSCQRVEKVRRQKPVLKYKVCPIWKAFTAQAQGQRDRLPRLESEVRRLIAVPWHLRAQQWDWPCPQKSTSDVVCWRKNTKKFLFGGRHDILGRILLKINSEKHLCTKFRDFYSFWLLTFIFSIFALAYIVIGPWASVWTRE